MTSTRERFGELEEKTGRKRKGGLFPLVLRTQIVSRIPSTTSNPLMNAAALRWDVEEEELKGEEKERRKKTQLVGCSGDREPLQ